MSLPQVVIVGRPNVGKSSLLNSLARSRISIVDPRAGITRDRVSVLLEDDGRFLELIDTGGIGIVDDDQLEAHVEAQIDTAIARADVILFVTDVTAGITALDQTIAERLRKLETPAILVANKVDEEVHAPLAAEFERLGFGSPQRVSAAHGHGRIDLMERVMRLLGSAAGEEAPGMPVMKLAIVGKRNAGKSTLVNALAGEQRMIVSEVPGTTRDAVDVRFEKDGRAFVAIDTAGVRKKKSMDDIDFYSYTRALKSIQRADVVMHLIDATVAVSDVDVRLARAALDETKPYVMVINKWDLAHGRATSEDFGKYISEVMPLYDYAPITLTTANTGKNVDAAVDVALSLHRQAHTRVTTGQLNAALRTVLETRAPSPKRGVRPVRIYYATQASVAPPTFVFSCNDPALVTESYRRFMENRLREILPFREVPLRLLFRSHRRESAERRTG
ncbi:MAG: ribosome biogenesis GTPase Der [Phycisphaerales bacterium]|nr:ribosome biogenesis GTPase Der [Phycisphaerales bacterium]